MPSSELLRIDLLYAFEAAARHLSFTKAADELAVTQSAVSRQIQQLEDNLHTPLFERHYRAITLTEAGQILQRAVSDSFERLLNAQARIKGSRQHQQVAITCTPAFASLWLIPRLANFTASHPLVDVRISASYELVDLEKSQIDLAIRFGPRNGTRGLALFEETLLPLCSPTLLTTKASKIKAATGNTSPLKTPKDLRHHTLLATESNLGSAPTDDWAPWLKIMGIEQLQVKNTVRFTQYSDAVAAAVAGQGVVIGRLPLLQELVQDGRLVAPFRSSGAASQRGYFLIVANHSENNRDAQDFARWLQHEARSNR